jgi:hypothetical protein
MNPFAAHYRIATVAFNDQAQCGHNMPVAGRNFAWHDQLEPGG